MFRCNGRPAVKGHFDLQWWSLCLGVRCSKKPNNNIVLLQMECWGGGGCRCVCVYVGRVGGGGINDHVYVQVWPGAQRWSATGGGDMWIKHGSRLSLAGAATSIIFVTWQIFVATNIILSRRAYFCCDKHVFVATKYVFLSWQKYACCDKHVLVATKRL